MTADFSSDVAMVTNFVRNRRNEIAVYPIFIYHTSIRERTVGSQSQ